MNNERTLFTNALLKEKTKTLQAVIDMANDLINTPGLSIVDACNKRGLNPSRTRSFLLYSTNIVKKGAGPIPSAGKNKLYLAPEEELFCSIFDISQKEISNTKLPPDLRKTIFFVMENALSETEGKNICMRYGLAHEKYNPDGLKFTLDEIGASCGHSRQRAQQITRTAIKRLRNPKYQDVLTYGLSRLQEISERAQKATFDKDILLKQNQEDAMYEIYQTTIRQPYFQSIDQLGLSVRLANCIKRAGIYGRFPITPYAIDLLLTPSNYFDNEPGYGAACREDLLRAKERIAREIGCSSATKGSAVCHRLLEKYGVSIPLVKTTSVAPALIEAIVNDELNNKEINQNESTHNYSNESRDHRIVFMGNAAV